jgi:hypothetical protein
VLVRCSSQRLGLPQKAAGRSHASADTLERDETPQVRGALRRPCSGCCTRGRRHSRHANLNVIVQDKTGEGGFGFSITSNLTRFYFDGRYDVFAAGIGFRASWKNDSEKRYPFEIGLYVAPQFAKRIDDGDSEGTVSTILHATLFKKFGVGLGFDAWYTDGGVSPDDVETSDRFFFTIGYGLTNETSP